MPFTRLNPAAFPGIAATQVIANAPVRLSTVATAPERGVQPVPTNNVKPDGYTHAGASYLRPVAMHERGEVVEAIAAASLGVGPVMIGTANASTVRLIPAAAASGVERWSVGDAVTPAGDGEYFSLYVNPRQISGLA